MSSQPLHNFSTTLEVKPNASINTTFTALDDLGEDRPRKRSVPPVHIPLLDFSKLHQPRGSVAKKDFTQAKGKEYLQQSKKAYTTIEPRAKSALNLSSDKDSQAKHNNSIDKNLDLSVSHGKMGSVEKQMKYRIDL